MQLANTALPIDAHGYFVLPDGERASGFRLDAATGARLRSVPEPLRAPPAQAPAHPTTRITYSVNLPSGSLPSAERRIRDMAINTESGRPVTILGCDTAAFLDATFAGGSIVIFNAGGVSSRLSFRWMKTGTSSDGAMVWMLFYLVNRKATFSEAAWKSAQRPYAVRPGGVSSREPNVLPSVSVNGALTGDIEVVHGPLGVTQYRDMLNAVKVNALQQNGAASGAFVGASTHANGDIIARYGNGRSIRYAQIVDCALAL